MALRRMVESIIEDVEFAKWARWMPRPHDVAFRRAAAGVIATLEGAAPCFRGWANLKAPRR